MKLTYSLFLAAIMIVANKGMAISDSMQDDSDVSESQQDLRDFKDILIHQL